MSDNDPNATNAKLRAETERLEIENRKLAADMNADLMEYAKLRGRARRRLDVLSEWLPTILLVIMGFGCVGVLVLFVFGARREHIRWEKFAKDHDCRVVERVRGDVDTTVAPIVDAKGGVSTAIGLTSTPDKTAYLCNDGVKYWR